MSTQPAVPATQNDQPKPPMLSLSSIDSMGFDSGPAFALLQKAAAFLATADLIPKIFHGNIPNCAIALNMAQRMRADVLMVMQNLYVVYGRPGWSSQFLIATINTSGEFSKLRYEWSAEKDKTKNEFGCRAWAVELATGEKLFGPWVTVGLSRAEGWYDRKSKEGGVASKWPTLTELMCTYRAAAFFVRTYAPEIAMGLRTSEEEEDTGEIDVTSRSQVLTREIGKPATDGDAPKSKLDALVDAGKGNGKGEAPKAPQPPAQPQEKGKTAKAPPKQQAAAPATATAGNPTYAESEPDPFATGELGFGREPGQEG